MNKPELQTETKTKVATSTKISIGVAIFSALVMLGTIILSFFNT